MTLVTGHTGHGKSTWLSEYSIDLAEASWESEDKLPPLVTYWGNFENRPERFFLTQSKKF